MNASTQVAVIGGGPAGAAAAIVLARNGVDVTLVEASNYANARIGETFPPRITPLLKQLGVFDALVAERVASTGIKSYWGSDRPAVQSFMLDPYNDGWHVERARFDAGLADGAERAGARVLREARLVAVERLSGRWSMKSNGQVSALHADFVIDGTGRQASVARRLGAERRFRDGLTALAFTAAEVPTADYGPYALIEAVPDGWWYSAPVPGARAVAVFLTDPSTARDRSSGALAWPSAFREARHTQARHKSLVFSEMGRYGAGSSLLHPLCGESWLAIGDAAMSFDPMSGDGVCRALQSGIDGGQAVADILAGDESAAGRFTAQIEQDFRDYCATRAQFYALERRWPNARFWIWARQLDRDAGAASKPVRHSPARLDPMAHFVEHEVPEPLAAVAQNFEHALVDEISQQDRIAGLDAIVDRVGGVPGVGADREGVAAVGRKTHLCVLGLRTVGKHFVEDGADIGVGVIGRQIELHRDPLPTRIGVRRDLIAGNVAGEDRDRIHADVREVLAETLLESRRQAADEGLLDRLGTERAADHVPQRAFFRRQIADVFREQVDLHARMRAVGEIVAFAAAVHRPVIGRIGLQRENLRIDIIGEYLVELEVEERLVDRARGLDRLRDVFSQAVGRPAAIVAGKSRGLVHH